MALNNYVLATVRKIIRSDVDVIGDGPVLALLEAYYSAGMDIYEVSPSLVDVIGESDIVVCDVSMTVIPSTNQVAPKKQIVKIIRGETKSRLDAIYKDFMQKITPAQKPPTMTT
jgi:hypothetical protein